MNVIQICQEWNWSDVYNSTNKLTVFILQKPGVLLINPIYYYFNYFFYTVLLSNTTNKNPKIYSRALWDLWCI